MITNKSESNQIKSKQKKKNQQKPQSPLLSSPLLSTTPNLSKKKYIKNPSTYLILLTLQNPPPTMNMTKNPPHLPLSIIIL